MSNSAYISAGLSIDKQSRITAPAPNTAFVSAGLPPAPPAAITERQWQVAPGVYITEQSERDWQVAAGVYLSETVSTTPPAGFIAAWAVRNQQVIGGGAI